MYITIPKPMVKKIWNKAATNISDGMSALWSKPSMNISEYADRYEIEVLIGQIDPKQVDVEVKEGILYISYKHNEAEQSDTDFDYIYQEFEVGSFERSYQLSDDADTDQIKAGYSRGILAITIAKKPQEPAKKVNIDIE